MDENEIAGKELNPQLVSEINNLYLILEGEEKSKGVFFKNDTEGYVFEVIGEKSRLAAKALTCGIQLMFGSLESQTKDKEESPKNYMIMGVLLPKSEVRIYTGITIDDEKWIMGVGKDYPEEILFLAIEMDIETPYTIEAMPESEFPEDDFIDIYIYKEEDKRVISN